MYRLIIVSQYGALEGTWSFKVLKADITVMTLCEWRTGHDEHFDICTCTNNERGHFSLKMTQFEGAVVFPNRFPDEIMV